MTNKPAKNLEIKKIILLLLSVLTIFSACKKDDAGRNSDRLIGRWKVETVAYVEYQNEKETERNQYSNLDISWEFRNDGTATVNFDGSNEQVRWAATENMIQFNRENDDPLDFRINSLTKNYLHVVYEDRVRVIDGINVKQTIEFTLRK